VGRREVRPAIVGFVVSVVVVVLASVGGDGGPGGGEAVADEGAAHDQEAALPEGRNEAAASDQELTDPIWLRDYTTHVPLIGYVYSPDDYDPHHLTLSEWKTLMCSLSPGVRARYEGVVLEQEEARKRERSREEAAYAAFVETRVRRLSGARASRK
jgi:hypothetical protein